MTRTLMAIGGALDVHGTVMGEFYRRSGGPDGKIVVLPIASADPESGQREATALQEMGLKKPAAILAVRERARAGEPQYLQQVEEATGIFLVGGNQMRLTAVLGGTPLYDALLAACERGAIIAGTSAGAAALSGIMIAYGKPGQAPRHGIVQLVPGLDFVSGLIFDQHFNQRNRLGRLLYAVATTPGLLGIGVDENTAAVLEGEQLTALGAGGVTIVDGAGMSDSTVPELEKNQLAAYSNIVLHLLVDGSSFDIPNRKAKLANKMLVTD